MSTAASEAPASRVLQKIDAHGHPLLPCPGEAHGADVGGWIDHCLLCAPQWGVLPAYKAASREALFLLDVLADAHTKEISGPRLPQSLIDAVEELVAYGYLERFRKDTKTRAATISFTAWRPTALGLDAIKRLTPKRGR